MKKGIFCQMTVPFNTLTIFTLSRKTRCITILFVRVTMDDFCQKCCRCCAVPKISILLSAATAVMYGLMYITRVIGQKEHVDCECGSFECCRVDADLCGDHRCYCEKHWSIGENWYCEERVELTRAAAIFSTLFWLAWWALLIATFASCCCFGNCRKDEAPQVSAIVTGNPRIEEPLLSTEVTGGIPVSNGPPKSD